MFSNPLVIAIIVLLSFNIFVFILVYGCRRCLRLPFQVNEAETRHNFGQRYANIKFESHSHCLT
jgi:NADH:ubiquinone oxidoreductase subunit H